MTTSDTTLVTGACGFVGSALCELLVRKGRTVVALDDMSLGHPDNWALDVRDQIEVEKVDICDAEGVEKTLRRYRPSAIFHLAAIHYIPACDADPARAIAVNVEGTQNLLTASVLLDSPRIVLASTGAVYAPSEYAHSEGDRRSPTDIYGMTKLWMEQAAQLHHRRTGAVLGVGRLFNVIGRGETNPHLLPEIVAQATNSSALHLGNLSTRRDYIHVDDIARGLIAIDAAAPEHGHLVCNLGAERAIDGNELVSAVGHVMGKELRVAVDARRVRLSDRPVLESDCSRARELLGWQAEVDLEGALRDALARPLAGASYRQTVTL